MNPAYPKLPMFLQRLALVLFSVLPVGLSLYHQLLYITASWSPSTFVRTGLIVGLLFLPLIAVVARNDLWTAIEKTGYIPLLWVIFLAIGLRLLLLPLLSTNFSSDMLDMHLFAVDVVTGRPFAHLEEYQGIPWAVHLDITGLVTSLIYRIFGASFATAKMFMVVLSGLTVWLVYLAGREVGEARAGLIAASLYGTLPALVTYSGVLSGEHFALPLLALSILLYGRLKSSTENRWSYSLAGYVLCGIAVGLIDWFRPGGIILLTALLITDLIYWKRETTFVRQLIPLGLLIVTYFLVSSMAVALSERFFRTDVMSAVEQSGHFILLGLNPEHKGVINNADRAIAFDAYERFGEDNAAANIYLIQLALERLKGASLLDLFQSKFSLIWSNHWQLFQISLNGSNDHEVVAVLSEVDSLIYLLVTILIGVNIYASFVNRSHPAVFAMQLFILGFAIWSLILEAQNRYAIITFPYQIILAALGLNWLATLNSQRPDPEMDEHC